MENRLVAAKEGAGKVGCKMDEGSQKVGTSSYKIKESWK